MSNLDFILPAPEAPRTRESASPRSSSKPRTPHEPFDTFMGQLLARKTRDSSANRAPARSPAKPRKEKAAPPDASAKSPDATAAPMQDQAAGASASPPPADPMAIAGAAIDAAATVVQSPAQLVVPLAATAGVPVGAEPAGPNPNSESGKPGAASPGLAALLTATGASLGKPEQKPGDATAMAVPSEKQGANEGPAPPAGKRVASEALLTVAGRDAPSGKNATPGSGEHSTRVDVVSQSTPGTAPAAGTDARGISVAQQVLAMQKAANMHESAGLSEQNLPGGSAAGAISTHTGGSEISLAAAATAFSHEISSPGLSGDIFTAVDSTSSLRAIERVQDLVSAHALRLHDSAGDALHVVIKPGSGLQLSLNLQMRGKEIEVQALLERGDFQLLSRHWPQLQQQLEPRGIHLAPLAANGQFAGSSGENFRQPNERPTRDDAIAIGDYTEFPAAGTTVMRPLSPGAKILRGWESWA